MIKLKENGKFRQYSNGEWGIKVSVTIDFISSKDSDEICTMHTKIDKIEIMKQMMLLMNF